MKITPPIDLQKDIAEFTDVLENNILAFWSAEMTDHNGEGFIGRIDGENNKHPDADRSVILNTRILWTFSAAWQHFRDEQYLQLAGRAFDYLLKYFYDKRHGGVYWAVDAHGKVTEPKKQIYAQAFMIYALSEYCRVSHDTRALELAVSIFSLIERYSFDRKQNGYLEAFDQEWNLLEDLRLSDKDANEKKTLNTHLHILEAYTNLFRIWPSSSLYDALKNLIQLFRDRFINDQGHFKLFFDENWNSRSDKISYGHDIEGSWLLYEAAEVLGDRALLAEIRQPVLLMADTFVQEGLRKDGGVFNDSEHGQYDGEIHWWPQAEAMVGLANAWQLTGEPHYLDLLSQVWQFTKEHIIDQENGEWFWGIDAAGQVLKNEDKAGPWKCPYHNSRALLELIKRL